MKCWTVNEKEFLITYYPLSGTNFCMNELNRSWSSIIGMATKLKLKANKNNSYTDNEMEFLKENYSTHGIEYCTKFLGRTKQAICAKAHELNLFIKPEVKSKNISEKRKINNYKKYDVSAIINISNKYVAYLLGYLWADGNLMKKNSSLTSINLVKDDAEFLIRIINSISSGWTIGNEVKKYWKNEFGEIKQAKNQRTIRCYSQELYDFLSAHDYENKSNVNFFKIWNKIPSNLKSYFILGLFDGDGHFNYQLRNKKYHSGEFVVSGSYDYDWCTLEKFCVDNNIEYSIYGLNVTLGQVSRFVVRKKESLISLFNILYSDDFHGLERKYLKFLKFYETTKK